MPFVDVPTDLCCPIDFEIFTDPVVIKTGHSYSRRSIERWFSVCQQKNLPIRSPATNEILSSTDLVPNRELQSRVSTFYESLLTEKRLQSAIETGDIQKLESATILTSELTGLFTTTMFAEGNGPAAKVPALMLAMLYKQTDVVRWLLKHVDIESRSAAGKTAMHFGCDSGPGLPIVALLLDAGADVNAVTPTGLTPLHLAVEHSPTLVPLLISKGADVNRQLFLSKRTPMFFANDIGTVKLLVAAGADLFAVDADGWSILFTVVDPTYFGQLVDLMTTIDQNKLPSAFRLTTDPTVTILTSAVDSLHPVCIRTARLFATDSTSTAGDLWHRFVRSPLLTFGGANRARDRYRPRHNHPLVVAVNPYGGLGFDCNICETFLKSAESVYHCNDCVYDECDRCYSYLPRASLSDGLGCIPLLAENGGDRMINAVDADGQTPILVLIQRIVRMAGKTWKKNELSTMVRVLVRLIQTGADPNLQDQNGRTAIDLLRDAPTVLMTAFDLLLRFADGKEPACLPTTISVPAAKRPADDAVESPIPAKRICNDPLSVVVVDEQKS